MTGATEEGHERQGPTGIRSALARRSFRLFFVGLVMSNTGMWFQNLAAALLVYDLTHSSLQVGIVNFAQFIGTVLLTPWSGIVADRADRRGILVRTQILAAAATFGLGIATLAGGVSTSLVIVTAGLVGVSVAFRTPAQLAIVHDLVPRSELEVGLSLNSLASNLPRAIGPLVASLLVVHVGVGEAFVINSAAFVLAAVAFARIPTQHHAGQPSSTRPKLIDTIRQLRSNRLLWALLVATVAFSIAADPAFTLAPEFGANVFGGSELFVGILVGSFGAGAATAALIGPSLMRDRRRALPTAMVIQAGGLALLAVSWNGGVAIVASLITGAGFLASIIRSSTRLQMESDEAQIGRIMAMWALGLLGPRPLAAIPDGLISDVVSPRVATALFAIPALAGAWYVNRALRRHEEDTGSNP